MRATRAACSRSATSSSPCSWRCRLCSPRPASAPIPTISTLTFEAAPGRPSTATIAAALVPFEGMAAFVGRPALLDGVALIPLAALPLYLQDPDRPFRIEFPDGFDGAYIQLKEIRGLGIRHLPRRSEHRLADAPSAQHRRRPAVQHGRRPQSRARFHGGAAGPGRRAGASMRSPRAALSPPRSRASAISSRRPATASSSSASQSATGSNSGRRAISSSCPALARSCSPRPSATII